MSVFKELGRAISRGKRGILVGGLVGFAIAKVWLVNNAQIIQASMASQGIYEQIVNSPITATLAQNKVVIVTTAAFSAIGYLIDVYVRKGKR